MPLLPKSESVKYSIEPPPADGRKRFIYVYDKDIPTKIRPHDRHLLIITGDPAVTTIGRTSPCPCQLNFESMPNTPFATEELEKEFWSKLHLMMPQRDADQEPGLEKLRRRRDRSRKAAAQRKKGNGEGSAQKTITDSSTDNSDSDDKEERERRQQRSSGGTATESVAERAGSDHERREDEIQIVSAQDVRGRPLLPHSPSVAERAESDHKRREDEIRIASAPNFRGLPLLRRSPK